MRPFWEVAIGPILDATRPRVVVEIGARKAHTTTELVDRLGPDAQLHVIDPLPLFDPAEHEARFAGRYVFHRDLSLNVLPRLPAADVALIDGDHNWYTVFNELKLLARAAREAGRPLPVLVMHDVCWPYGRRDLYYDPERIPEEFRHPYRRQGIKRGARKLVPRGGLNAGLANAVVEGGPRNGVAGALDDFLAEHDRPVRRVVLPFRFGLAVVVEEERLAGSPALAALLDELEPRGRQKALLEVAEDVHLEAVTAQHTAVQARERAAARYLDLLQAALLDEHYLEHELRIQYLMKCARDGTTPDAERLRDPARLMAAGMRRLRALRRSGRQPGDRTDRRPYSPYTDVGRVRLAHLERCLDAVRTEGVPGDLVECGTGHGGAAIYLRGYLEAREMPNRRVWVADAFRPGPGSGDLDAVRDGFARFGLLDDRVRFLQGPPAATLHDAPVERVALLRIGDPLEGSPRDVLDALYDRLAVGGFVVVEDHGRPRQAGAAERFRAERGIEDPLERVDAAAVAWRKTAEAPRVDGGAPAERAPRPAAIARPRANGRALSVVVVFYDMRREAERTLHSLSRAYQQGVEDLDYEVIAVENGSAPDERLGESFVRSFGPEFRYLDLGAEATPSPAQALNRGIAQAHGEALALMIDGAHVLTPGVLRFGMTGLETYAPAIVATQQWYVGPGQQPETVHLGYDEAYEDRLFQRIGWPGRGYELFEIGQFVGGRDWFDELIESNCLFAPRSLLEQVGAFDESFAAPGGGLANLELYSRLGESPGVTVATIIGEGSFHQFHGGTTTNAADRARRRDLLSAYRREFAERRGHPFHGGTPGKLRHFVGHMPRRAERTRARPRAAPSPLVRAVMPCDPDGVPEERALVPDDVTAAYTDAYWRSLAWRETSWLGRPVARAPADILAYQELVARLRPDWIVATHGDGDGLSPFLASLCALVDGGGVLSVGAQPPAGDGHPRVTAIAGEPAEEATVRAVGEAVGGAGSVLVVLGRAAMADVLAAFAAYAPLVPVGGYVVVEDTVVNGHPVWPGFGAGPAEAVSRILRDRADFEADRGLERYGPTFNPGGYLRRVRRR